MAKSADAHVAWSVRDRLRGFLASYEEAKGDAAVVDFQDLLLRTRHLLTREIRVRRYFQGRFDFILLDEFQDTDPLQVEIAFLLAEDPETGPAVDWKAVRLKRGKLFLVGDPKQSIYRFRRADIALYQEAKRLVVESGGEVLALDTSFRTVPSIVGFVNELFEDVFADPETDPDPLPLTAFRGEVDRDGARTVALPIPRERLPEDGARTIPALAPVIAGTIAAFLDEITRRRPWSIRDGEEVRAARPGDVALLVRKTTPESLGPLERALTAHGVSYRIVGGKQYFARDEVRALGAVLRAIDNPADRLALFAALRSPFFAFSDDDLWQLVSSGGALSYQAPSPESATTAAPARALIAPAFDTLKHLHRLRRVAAPSEVLLELLARTRALPGFRLRPEGEQLVANLWKATEMARAYEAAGPTTLREVVRFLEEEAANAGGDEGDSPVGEEAGASVAVTTVHSAKGLEYPIVVLGDVLSGRGPTRQVVIDHAAGAGWLKIGSCKPEGWDEADEREKRQAEAEEHRLLYVALTRAKDHLVVPCLTEETKGAPWTSALTRALVPPGAEPAYGMRASAMRSGAAKRGRSQLTVFDARSLRFDEQRPVKESLAAVVEGGEAEINAAVAAEQAWSAGRAIRPSEPGQEGDIAGSVEIGSRADLGETAAAFGRLVHKLLATPGLADGAAFETAALALRGSFGLGEEDAREAARLALPASRLPEIAAAAEADLVFREQPFSCRLGGRLASGRFDLAYRKNGSWTLVDFKTARLASAAEAKDRYTEQLGRYRQALGQLSGEPVAAALCLGRPGRFVAL